MKAFVAAVVIGVAVAVGAALVLDTLFQVTSPDAFTTGGARVGHPGNNLLNF